MITPQLFDAYLNVQYPKGAPSSCGGSGTFGDTTDHIGGPEGYISRLSRETSEIEKNKIYLRVLVIHGSIGVPSDKSGGGVGVGSAYLEFLED